MAIGGKLLRTRPKSPTPNGGMAAPMGGIFEDQRRVETSAHKALGEGSGMHKGFRKYERAARTRSRLFGIRHQTVEPFQHGIRIVFGKEDAGHVGGFLAIEFGNLKAA